MNELQKLALEHIQDLSEELDTEIIQLGNTLRDEELILEKHTFPLASKAREITRWTKAILDEE
jgi:hypothetical protein